MNITDLALKVEALESTPFAIWFLIGAALVFFMQAGFAMVETGFTRAKNAGNIIMKNLMDFCIGCALFIAVGFTLMMSENYIGGVIGVPNWKIFTDYSSFDASSFIFNLVFCATAATIVSGAMAERTKFSSYCLYSAAISAVVYPIEAGWVWNSQGWLFNMGFIDFAGSGVIHMVGGVTAFIGASILGARIGKYSKDKKTGKKVSHAIPGHSITLGALGVFILWFGWYGFNGAAATDMTQLSSIFVTTTIAPAIATIVTMLYTWKQNGKPDVSMSLNASLAGLVAITASCANVDALGSVIIGAVAGVLVVVSVEFIDLKLHVDDPVGAVAVHGVNGLWGVLAAGLFATDTGLFYTGSFHQLGVQAIGVVAILAWTSVVMYAVFKIINITTGLRTTQQEEIDGMDISEHGLVSAYPDFMAKIEDYGVGMTPALQMVSGGTVQSSTVVNEAVPVVDNTKAGVKNTGSEKLTKIEVLMKQEKFDSFKAAMMDIGITGMTVYHVLGCGIQHGKMEYYRGVAQEITLLPKVKVSMVVSKVPVSTIVDTAKKVLYTGHIGDGKIFISDIENVIKVRTGEEGYSALQDEEQ